jgi:predicted PurR-regulated permease PerM
MVSAKTTKSSASDSILVFGGVILLLLFARALLIPLAFALALSFLLLPAVQILERRGWRRAFAVTLVSGITLIAFLGAAYLLSRQVLHVLETLPAYGENLERKLEALHLPSGGHMKEGLALMERVSNNLISATGSEPNNVVAVRVVTGSSDQLLSTATMLGTLLEPLGQLGIVLVFTLYMLINREELRHRLLLLAGMGKLNLVTKALDDAATRISQYLVLQFRVNACYGVLFGIGLFCIGIPEATLWGVIAGGLRIVPFLGTLGALVLPLVLAVGDPRGWWPSLALLAMFLVLELVTANFVEPWLFRSRTGISELAFLASAIFWSILWGFPGLVLSTPLTVCVVVLGRYVPEFEFLHSLLGTNARLSPAAHLYERLMAMDQKEAWAIAERYLHGKPLSALYDDVVLPVMSLAEEDRYKGELTAVQSKFVLLSIGELVARLSNYSPAVLSEGDHSLRSIEQEARRAHLQKHFAVICIAGEDEADALANVMLAQVLESCGQSALVLTADALSDEILDALGSEKDTVIMLSALPPFAFARTRALCQRVRTRLPDNRIAVGLWNSAEEGDETHSRFGKTRPEVVVSTLSAATEQINAWQLTTQRS